MSYWITLVGGGGKTTTMFHLAKYFREMGKTVIVTTTTHIAKVEDGDFDLELEVFLLKEGANPSKLQRNSDSKIAVIADSETKGKFNGFDVEQRKFKGLDMDTCRKLDGLADVILVEGDGAKGLPIKVPLEHEPVILDSSDEVLICMGLDALHQELSKVCFRYERGMEEFGFSKNRRLSEEDAVRILTDVKGGRKPGNAKKYSFVLNKADDANRVQAAHRMAQKIASSMRRLGAAKQMGRVYITCYEDGKFYAPIRPKMGEMLMETVWIKGAGDLASGIAMRLYACGFSIVMTDIAVPTTVRRTVAFSPAVYQKHASVEDVDAIFCESIEEVKQAHSKRKIAVVLDLDKTKQKEFAPQIVVDAIIAKQNIATTKEEAKIVIGVGPGFVAGVDCHAVIETKRGHDLGRVIREGSASPNTGVPGLIGGYGTERIIRANADGVFHGLVKISDTVRAGDVVGESGGVYIRANIDGIVRGLLQDGVEVHKGMKSGDIDPRAVYAHCFTVSDKARAIGGGVLEAILSLQNEVKSWE